MSRTFTKGFIASVAREEWDEQLYPDLEIVSEKDEGSSGRWCNLIRVVFHLEGKHYMFTYQVCASETSWGSGTFEGNIQLDDPSPWTDIKEVVEKDVVVKQWVPI